MALLDTNLLFQHSVVRLRATAADGVKLRTMLSSSEPLRLEIFDGEDNKKESVTRVAIVQGGRDEETLVSRAVFLTIEAGGVAYLRLDNLLSELIGEVASSEKFSLISDLHSGNLIALPTFRAAIHFAAASAYTTSRVFPLSTVILRAGGVDFPFTRELLCLHSEFFCALLYGSFTESGKDLVELDTFTVEEIDILYRVIQRGLPVKTENAMEVFAVADRVLSPSLKAKLLALPIPTKQEEKEEWLLYADKYNSVELASRIVLSITRREIAKLHLKLFDKISNKEINRLLLMHSAGKLRDPWGTYVSMDLGRFGTVHFRLFTDEVPDMVQQFLMKLPMSTILRAEKPDFFVPEVPISRSGRLVESHARWTLCSNGDEIDIKLRCDHYHCYPIGEVVDGAEILERGIVSDCNIRFTS